MNKFILKCGCSEQLHFFFNEDFGLDLLLDFN